MPIRQIVKVGLDEGKKIRVKDPVGADISIIMDSETVGTRCLTENVTRVKPGVILQPCHSHRDIEEIIYVIEGQGEVLLDEKTCRVEMGDSVLFPCNSKHTVKNKGEDTLVLLCFFSSPHYRRKGTYITHEEVTFK